MISIALLLGCSGKTGDSGARQNSEREASTLAGAPTDARPSSTRPRPIDATPTCASDMELQSSTARFDCAEDRDCRNSCKYGAINRTWYRVLGSACKDGCEGQNGGAPRCVDRKCAAFTRAGTPDDSCTNLPAPDSTQCVQSTR